jgi:hypothetical protein
MLLKSETLLTEDTVDIPSDVLDGEESDDSLDSELSELVDPPGTNDENPSEESLEAELLDEVLDAPRRSSTILASRFGLLFLRFLLLLAIIQTPPKTNQFSPCKHIVDIFVKFFNVNCSATS